MPIATLKSNPTLKHPAVLCGAATLGLVVGLAANFGRKAVIQGLTAAHGEWDAGLKAEHQAALKIFDVIETTDETSGTRRKMLLMQLKHALSKHAFEEENIIYPAMRDHGQIEEADALIHDHGYVKQYLYDLSELDPGDVAWMTKIRAFREELETHMSAEEDEIFPKLRAALGKDGNAHLTRLMNKAGFIAA